MTNSNVNNNAFVATLAQPTNSDGTLKATVWQTKGVNLLANGLSVVETETGLIINDKAISNTTLQVKAMQSVFDGSEKLESFLDYMSAGFTSAMQANAAKGETTKSAKPLAGHVLTGLEFLDNSIKESTTFDNMSLIYNQLISLSDKDTKADILVKIKYLADAIIAPDRVESINILFAKEEEARTRFNPLYLIGFADVKQFGDTFVSIISATEIANGINALSASGFELFGSPVLSAADMTFKVSFKTLNIANNI